MDKKNLIPVMICFVLLLTYQPILNHFYPPAPAPAAGATAANAPEAPAPAPAAESAPEMTPAPAPLVPETALAPEQTAVLENDFIRVEFTSHGGGVRRIELKQHKAEGDAPVILNNGSKTALFNITGWSNGYSLIGYKLESSDAGTVVFSRVLSSGLEVKRVYTLAGDYSLNLEQTVYNQGQTLQVLPSYRLSLGAATPVHPADANEKRYIGCSWHTGNGDYSGHKLAEFDPASFLGLKLWGGNTLVQSKEQDQIDWVALNTQFFVMLTNCVDFHAKGVEGHRNYYPELRTQMNQAVPAGFAADLAVPGVQVAAGGSFTQKFSLYAGPKQDSRLRALGGGKERVMDFGMFGFVSRGLLIGMNWIHSYTRNYGVTVIILTILLRIVLWVPQSAANKSMKRMQAVSPLLKEIQDKYKDKPEKLNEEMLKLYRDYGVNPVGGCLPMLIQFPIFLGFYSMLQGAIELRHQPFLWIHDLSQPDTIAHLPIPGYELALNPMPLIMTVTMFISMRMTPQPAGVDNPTAKVMKFMPFMFLVFCYNFSSALSLYWTMQNILSIIQMRYNLKQAAPSLEEMKAQVQAKRKKKR